jgi:hypothetical protein
VRRGGGGDVEGLGSFGLGLYAVFDDRGQVAEQGFEAVDRLAVGGLL